MYVLKRAVANIRPLRGMSRYFEERFAAADDDTRAVENSGLTEKQLTPKQQGKVDVI